MSSDEASHSAEPAHVGTLERIARAIHGHQAVNTLTADPDPAPTHIYQCCSQSGAGNCVCGAAEHHRRHPHDFWAAASDQIRCVCGLSAAARCHVRDQPCDRCAFIPTPDGKCICREVAHVDGD